jgi:phosphatidylserine decarboxylase
MGARPLPLPLWDRRAGKLVYEFMDDAPSTYESQPRRSLNQWLESHPLAGVRPFPSEPASMGAFAEARYLAWERLDQTQEFPIKGRSLDAAHILGSASRARDFADGPVILARLSPMDYHHVHYSDDGRTLGHDRMGGRLWTVNWHALLSKPDILFENERHISILEMQNFGRIGFVEIGALSVGRIVQVHFADKPFQRGEEKSIFRFGGSAIAVFGQAGRWRPSADVLKNTVNGIETMLRLGEEVARIS